MKIIKSILFCTLFWSFAFAQSGEFKTSYHTFGTGTPILIINGGPGFSSEGFKDLAKKLSTSNQVILYDQRGTGQSMLPEISSETISMDLMVQDIEDLREKLEIDSWVLLGHSFGGMLAAYYASSHPNRILAMVMSSSGGLDLELLNTNGIASRLSPLESDSLNFYSRKIQQGDTTKTTRLKRTTFLASAYLYHKKYIPIVAERLTQGNLHLNGLVWQDMRRINFDTKPSLRTFKKPVLILHGAEDVVPLSVAETMHKTFPISEMHIMEKCSHYGWLDNPEKYFGAIFKFLKRHNLS